MIQFADGFHALGPLARLRVVENEIARIVVARPPQRLEQAELFAMWSGWDDPAGFFLAGKGGRHYSHSQLDHGTFVFDAMGERWFHDLGKESYNLPGYKKNKDDYRRRASARTRQVKPLRPASPGTTLDTLRHSE
jgi:hypothetical protein